MLLPSGDPCARTNTGVALYQRGVPRLLFSGAGYGGDNARNLVRGAEGLAGRGGEGRGGGGGDFDVRRAGGGGGEVSAVLGDGAVLGLRRWLERSADSGCIVAWDTLPRQNLDATR